MEYMPQNIKSIICVNSSIFRSKVSYSYYKIKRINGDETGVFTERKKYDNQILSTQIKAASKKFVNGFKLVKMSDDKYAYIQEKDMTLLPYRYDYATNFNEFGLAIVGKDGGVSWINKDFKYLNSKGEMVIEENGLLKYFDGWQGLYNFSGKENPLSRLFSCAEEYGKTVYFDTNGKIKDFYQNDGSIINEFYTGEDFNEHDQAVADNYVLLSKGFCTSLENTSKKTLKKSI